MAQQQYIGNVRSNPRWAGDYLGPQSILPIPARMDPAQFTDSLGVVVTVDTGGAAQSATSIPVKALSPPLNAATTLIAAGNVIIPAGTTLSFGGLKFATTTADAIIGATALTVAAIPTALVAGDVATFSQFPAKFIPSGTVIGRTASMQQSGALWRPAVNTDAQIRVTCFDCVNATVNSDAELYRPQRVVKVNYLPGYGTGKVLGTLASPTSLLTALLTIYVCELGQD